MIKHMNKQSWHAFFIMKKDSKEKERAYQRLIFIWKI